MLTIRYIWQGIDKSGTRISGETSLTQRKTALQTLRNQGVLVDRIRLTMKFLRSTPKVKFSELINFIRQLATLINAGIPIVQAISLLQQNQEHQRLQHFLTTLRRNLETGNPISTSFAKSKCFDHLFCSLLNVGEQSGTLDKVLNYIVTYQEKSLHLRQKIKKALLYPLTVLLLASAVTVVMLTFVIPQFAELYHGFGAQLPAYTRFIMALSHAVQKHGMSAALAITIFCWGMRVLIKSKPKLRKKIAALTLHAPMVGAAVQMFVMARLFYVLSITQKAGLPLLQSFAIANEVITHPIYHEHLTTIQAQLLSGQSLTAIIKARGIFPNYVVQMINTGEESGSLDLMLTKIAEYYEGKLDYFVANLNTLLEPIIMAILGAIIGGLIIGMYLPIFRMGTVM